MTDAALIAALAGRFIALGTSAMSLQETEVRVEYIDPLLELLGWDMANVSGAPHHLKDVLREEADTSKRPDYTFRLSGARKFFVEAKRPSVDISTHAASAFQARSYGWTAGLPISVLTNFRSVRIYDTRHEPKPSDGTDVALVACFDVADYAARAAELAEWLSRASVASGSASGRWAAPVTVGSVAADQFLARIDGWRKAIATQLRASGSMPLVDAGDIAQKVISRIIFVRMCEDRGIEGEEGLRAVARSGDPAALTDFFTRLDDRYNTGLFDVSLDPFSAAIALDPAVFSAIVEEVYAPASPYSFGVLDADFLGEVYERFLTKQLGTKTTQGLETVILVDKPQYEHREIVTTPQILVDELSERAFARVCANLEPQTPADALALRVLDPAVGSGRFLLRAFDLLSNYVVEHTCDPAHFIVTSDGSRRPSFALKRQIASACLFGIDVDLSACEIARFSLIVKILEGEGFGSLPNHGNLLPDLDRNVIWGNAIVSEPIGDDSLVPIDWTAEGLPETFDLVLGNPPYVQTKDILASSVAEHGYLSRVYETCRGQFDKYFAFIERCVSRTADNGVVALLVPNKWMTIQAGRALRTRLASEPRALEISDFGTLQLFQGRNVYVCFLIIYGDESAESHYRRVNQIQQIASRPVDRGLNLGSRHVRALGGAPWILPSSSVEKTVLDRLLADHVPLSHVAHVRNGIQTSANAIFILKGVEHFSRNGQDYVRFQKNGAVWEIETGCTRPFLDEVESTRGFAALRPDARVVFPYAVGASAYPRVLEPHELRAQYPLAFAYLTAHQDALTRRSVEPRPPAGVFYAYGRHQALDYVFGSPKIIYSVNQRGDRYWIEYDNAGYASGGTAGEVGIFVRDGQEYTAEFVLAALAQPPMEMYLRLCGSSFQGGYYARGSAVMNTAPLPRLDLTDPRVSTLYERICSTSQSMVRLGSISPPTTPRARETIRRELTTHQNLIAAWFMELWQLDRNAYRDCLSGFG